MAAAKVWLEILSKIKLNLVPGSRNWFARENWMQENQPLIKIVSR